MRNLNMLTFKFFNTLIPNTLPKYTFFFSCSSMRQLSEIIMCN